MDVMERKISSEVVGVRIFRSEDSIAERIVVSTPGTRFVRSWKRDFRPASTYSQNCRF